MYASPEVASEGFHGRASDIFSLGCVLLEMATVYSVLMVESLKRHVQQLAGTLDDERHFYHNSLDRIRSWITTLGDMKVSNKNISSMLNENPESRPSLVRQLGLTNVIDLECLHHHDPPDWFEADAVSVANESDLEPALPAEPAHSAGNLLGEKPPHPESTALREELSMQES
jgi:serine/threonine protein kinase